MTVTPKTYRDAKAMLIDVDIASVHCLMTIISLTIDTSDNAKINSSSPLESIRLSSRAVADRLGWNPSTVSELLQQANVEMQKEIGIEIGHIEQMAGVCECLDSGEQPPDLILSPTLMHIIRGSAITPIDAGNPSAMVPDKTSIAMIGLISRVSATGGGGILYREADGAGERIADMTTVAATIADRATNGGGIAVQTYGSQHPIMASVICAVLHGAGVLVLCDDILEPAGEDVRHTDWLDEQTTSVVTPWRSMTSTGMRLLRLLGQAPIAIIVPIPKEAILSPKTASNFITAIGPMRRDRSAAVAAVQEIADGRLSDPIAERIIDIWDGHAEHARCGLEAVTRLLGQSFPDERPKRRDRADLKSGASRSVAYSALADAMTGGIAPHVWSPVTLQPKPTAVVFHRELFVSEPDAELLFSDRLREERGIRILLMGPPGTGKSAAASHIASNVLGMPHYDLRAGDVLFYRLGALERAIAKAFQQAREWSAVLIIDEAESLVQDRATASPNSAHLITAITNAVLIELDRHPLPVLMATNFGDRIDPAVKRRLDFTFEVKPIPEHLEGRALRLLLDLDPPSGFVGFGGDTAISDYAGAKRVLQFQGGGVANAIAAVGRARDVRLGKHGKATRRVGF